MPDSFSELRTAGGPNKPWVVGGVLALIVAIIGVALAAAYWYANPKPEPVNEVPETVTVTAQPQFVDDPPAATESISGTFTGILNSLEDDAKAKAWPAVATFGGGTASVTYPLTGCTALIGEGGESIPLTKGCNDGQGRWDVEKHTPGVVKLTYLEDDIALVEGELSAGLP